MTLRPAAVTGFLLMILFALPVLSAGMYQWEDEDGNIVFSDHPPPDMDMDYRQVEQPTSGADSEAARRELDEMQKRLDDIAKQREKREQEQAEQQREREIMQANCQQARDKLERLTRVTRVLTVEDDGTYRRIDESERQAQQEEALKEIAEYCR